MAGILARQRPFVPLGRTYGRRLLLPLGIGTCWIALTDGLAGPGTTLAGPLSGGVTLAFPIVMLSVKSKPNFRQDKAPA